MNAVMLYLILLKATITTFAGLASLPVLREDLVVKRHVLTDNKLDTAIVVTRTTPGPVGVYVVSVGYFVDGVPGAVAGCLAMVTPALLISPLIAFAGLRAQHPRIRGMIQMVVLASAGLLWATAGSLVRQAAVRRFDMVLVAACLPLLLARKVETIWIVISAGAVSLIFVRLANLF